ncbi:MAG: murein L,D-transpeptidase catalytic domain family protein [Rhizobacter sp.]|nr:murein L,D-transpeptidase catalytic domain family protein [Bacteriovorax sp.]
MKKINISNILAVIIIFSLSSAVYSADNKSKKLWLKFSGTNYCSPNHCAENIPFTALEKTLSFYKKNQNVINNTDYAGIIDMGLPSTVKRFFILNLKDGSVQSLLVTHGKKSETEKSIAGTFSNEPDSEMTSLGFYITDEEAYTGKHGISLRLDGISDTNSNARLRNIVLHSADYATQWFADEKGRLGLSQGCPAVAPDKIEGVIKKLKGQALLYIHK